MIQQDTTQPTYNPSDHLANERTFLAWIRTSIGIMAFGFVVVKFTLFVRQLAFILHEDVPAAQHGYSSAIGIFMVAFGVLIGLLAFIRYRHTGLQLSNRSYRPNPLLSIILMVFIIAMGIVLVAYLIYSIV